MAINQMNKHVNHLSMRKLLGIEKTEHGLSSKPSESKLSQMEKREHGLKKTPSKEQILRIETKEHGVKGNKAVDETSMRKRRA